MFVATCAYRIIKVKVLILILLSLVQEANAYEVFHQLKPGATFDTVASGGACLTIEKSYYTINCNPALFSTVSKNLFSIKGIAKADGEAVNTSKNLLTKKIEEQTLRELFENDSFNSLTFGTSIELISDYFILGYTPAYYLSDILLFNPALPQVSMLLAKRDETYVTIASNLKKIFSGGESIHLGLTLRYASMRLINETFTLLDLSDSQRSSEIRQFKKYKGIEVDLGAYIKSPYHYLPNLSLVAKNLGSVYPQRELMNETDGIEVYHVFEPRMELGLGYPFHFDWGNLELSVLAPWSEKVKSIDEELVATLKYGLDFFSVYTSAGYYKQNIGFMTMSQIYSLGLVFSNEKEIRGFNADYQKSVYLALEIIFE